jgi:hypothetical protein
MQQGSQFAPGAYSVLQQFPEKCNKIKFEALRATA